MKKFLSWIKHAVLFTAVFLGALKLGDLALGAVFDINQVMEPRRYLILREPVPGTKKMVKPNATVQKTAEGVDQSPVAYRVDADGFILGPATSSGPVDMIFLGGSTTECLYMQETERFPALVSTLLAREDGSLVRVLNAGRGGNNMMHSLLITLAKIPPYQPRFVVFMEAINDLSQLSRAETYWEGPSSRSLIQYFDKKGRSIPYYHQDKGIKDILFPNSWEILKPYVAKLFLPRLLDEFADYRDEEKTWASFESVSAQYYKALKTAVATVRLWDSEPILMTQFNRLQLDDEFIMTHTHPEMRCFDYKEFVERYKAFNNIIRRVAEEENVRLIDLDKGVPHTSQYMYDAVHLNQEGSRFVAHLIAEYFASQVPGYTLVDSLSSS